MYSSTSTTGNVLQTIPVGAKVDQLSAHGATGSWFKVRYANVTGYVAARNFSLTPPATSTEQYGTEREGRISVENNGPLNVREKATTSSNKVGELPSGTIVKVKPVLTTDWGIITNGGFAGNYIHLAYTTAVTTPPPSTGIQRVVSYTTYPISVRTMAERQMAQFGQTDAHRYAKAYLPRSWVKVDGSTGSPELEEWARNTLLRGAGYPAAVANEAGYAFASLHDEILRSANSALITSDGEAIEGAAAEEVEVMGRVTFFINSAADDGGDESPV
jgi:hypothetical protein